jgi:hypothetical protein
MTETAVEPEGCKSDNDSTALTPIACIDILGAMHAIERRLAGLD